MKKIITFYGALFILSIFVPPLRFITLGLFDLIKVSFTFVGLSIMGMFVKYLGIG